MEYKEIGERAILAVKKLLPSTSDEKRIGMAAYAMGALEERNHLVELHKKTIEDVDWEQRRYEIAKDIIATSHIAQQLGSYSYREENEVKDAVKMADLLIEELKKQ